jgi:hypothetical protein
MSTIFPIVELAQIDPKRAEVFQNLGISEKREHRGMTPDLSPYRPISLSPVLFFLEGESKGGDGKRQKAQDQKGPLIPPEGKGAFLFPRRLSVKHEFVPEPYPIFLWLRGRGRSHYGYKSVLFNPFRCGIMA